VRKVLAAAVTFAVAVLGLVAMSPPAVAAGAIPVVTIGNASGQATVSQATMRPGVVEFHVGSTFRIPGPDGGPEQVTVIRTDQLDTFLAQVPLLFGDPSDPTAGATAAQAIRTIHSIATAYGGNTKGGVWQVSLPPGTYYALGIQSSAMGLSKPVSFTVSGSMRQAALHATQATVRAVGSVGKNRWTFTQPGGHAVEWLRFANSAKELHFLDLMGVKSGTTAKDVKASYNSQGPPTWLSGQQLHFDAISPGVSVAIKQHLPAGRYLAECFMPSESDGMPHALMGMWKLIDVR
jgi:hypothetical protein